MYIGLLKKSFQINSSYRPFKSISVSGYLSSKLANFLIPIFLILKIKPNTITIINFFVGCFCIIFLFIFDSVFFSYSVLLYIINKILDHCDGGLARFYKKKTFFGKLIDSLSDAFFFSFFNLSLAIFFYLKTNNLYIIIFGAASSIFICFDIFILDKFSSLVRWCNHENKKNFSPYLRKKIYPRVPYSFEDIAVLGVILLFYFKDNLILSQKILYLIFLTYTISFFFNLLTHLIFGYKFLNFNKK